MKRLDLKATHSVLSSIVQFELAGVVRYTHYSLMVTGPNRIPIVQFLKQQANESLLHAQQAGEILTGLLGHPDMRIAPIPESHRHSVEDVLRESLAHEESAVRLYKTLLDLTRDRSVYIEEFARTQIALEEMHSLELRKMLRDIGADGYHRPAGDPPARANGQRQPGTRKRARQLSSGKGKPVHSG